MTRVFSFVALAAALIATAPAHAQTTAPPDNAHEASIARELAAEGVHVVVAGPCRDGATSHSTTCFGVSVDLSRVLSNGAGSGGDVAPVATSSAAPAVPTAVTASELLSKLTLAKPDLEQLAQNIATGNVAGVLTGLQKVVNDVGVESLSLDGGKLQVGIGLATTASLFTLGQGRNLQPVFTGPNEGGAGVAVDLGFSRNGDGSDRGHVGVFLAATGALQGGQAVGGEAVGLYGGWQPGKNWPTFGLGPAVFCPNNGSGLHCTFGMMVTPTYTAPVAKVPAPTAQTSTANNLTS